MLKSLGLEWNVDETDELEIDENSAHSQSEEQQRRKSRRNRKRETKQKVDTRPSNVTGDETKVKDGADKDDRSQPGNRDGDNLAEELGGTKMKEESYIEILVAILNERMFNQLRMKEQLCYKIGCEVKKIASTVGITLFIQSDKYDPEYLYLRVLEFLDNFYYDTFTENLFEEYKKGLL